MPGSRTKSDAQRRADQIAAFRAELDALGREGLPPLDSTQLAAVAAHHDRLLADLARQFDVDRGAAEKRMSMGMRLASLFGAAALTAAIVSFVYRVWGVLPTAGHVALLTAAPIAATAIMIAAGWIEKTRYVAALFAIVACAGLVLQTLMFGLLFNMAGTPHVLLIWAVFAFAVAVPWRFGVPFAWGIVALICYIAAFRLWIFRAPWMQFPQQLEPIAVTACLVASLYRWMPRDLAAWGRGAALVIAMGALLALSWDRTFYQVVAVMAGPAVVVAALKHHWPEAVTIAALFTAVFLLLRFVDWWWDWMPRYLFFLILTGVALAWLWGLRLARRRLAAA
jgi:hypothetical protein